MKALAGIGIVLLALAVFYLYAASRSERIARFINFRNDLKDAHAQLHTFGKFTNRSRDTSINVCTNLYAIGGTNYQCEFAGENQRFANHGRLAITTNEVFVWLDNKGRAIPLLRRDTALPPGL